MNKILSVLISKVILIWTQKSHSLRKSTILKILTLQRTIMGTAKPDMLIPIKILLILVKTFPNTLTKTRMKEAWMSNLTKILWVKVKIFLIHFIKKMLQVMLKLVNKLGNSSFFTEITHFILVHTKRLSLKVWMVYRVKMFQVIVMRFKIIGVKLRVMGFTICTLLWTRI